MQATGNTQRSNNTIIGLFKHYFLQLLNKNIIATLHSKI